MALTMQNSTDQGNACRKQQHGAGRRFDPEKSREGFGEPVGNLGRQACVIPMRHAGLFPSIRRMPPMWGTHRSVMTTGSIDTIPPSCL